MARRKHPNHGRQSKRPPGAAGAPTLSPRHAAFAAAYAKHGNAERAAVEAGYSASTARKQASRLSANVGIAAEVARMIALASDRAQMDVDDVIEEATLIASADLADFVEWGYDPDKPDAPQVRLIPSAKLDAARRRAIVEVSQTQHGVRIKLADKLRASELLGKRHGIFADKVEHSGKVETGAPIVNLSLTVPPGTGEVRSRRKTP